MAESAEGVKLLGFKPRVSPYVLRAEVALILKGVEYQFEAVEIFGQKSDLLVKFNPVYKKVPVLIHRGKPICESAVILHYIDEVWTGDGAPSILPADPLDRAAARFWTSYVDEKLFQLFSCIGDLTVGATADAATKAAAREQAAEVFRRMEEALAKCGGGKGFFGGDTIGYLDIILGSWMGWIELAEKMCGIEMISEEVPLLRGWAERFVRHEAVGGVLPGIHVFEEYCRLIRPAMASTAAAGASSR